MICLGIESTAHTFGVGIVEEKGRILADERSIYLPSPGKGIIPREAAEHHRKSCWEVIKRALTKAKVEKPDLVAWSQGPGLPPCLLVGLRVVKKLLKEWRVPLVNVNHCIAHLEIGRLVCECKDPVMLYLSGGNTQVIAFEGGRYRIFGETLDVPLGNALDCFARAAGLGFPGGPAIERLARKGEKYIEIPYVVKGMDVSFSGILTYLEKLLMEQKHRLEDLCYSLQETTFAMLVEVSERAIAHTQKEELLLTGGVAANRRLQEMCRLMCRERGARFYVVPSKFAGDQGVMIAWNGILAKEQARLDKKIDIKPRWRTDEVSIGWRSL